jgi:hypothetical protein
MPIEANLVLAVAAEVLGGGGINLTGGGWAVRPPEPMPCAIAVFLTIPRDEAGTHQAQLELLYSDGEPVLFSTASMILN